MFDFFVHNSFGCEKIIIEGKEAQVKGLEDPQGKTLLVEFEFNMVPQVQVKKEEDEMDAEEENNDVASQYHTHSKGKRCIIERGLKRAASMEKRDARAKKRDVSEEENDARAKKRDVSEEENDARAKKRDVSEEENDASAEKVDVSEEKNDVNVRKKKDVPDHFGVELFSSGHFTQPKNPYFVTKIRPKRRDDLYIPIDVTRDNNIKLPAKVILWDERDKKYEAYLKTWADGRTWLSGGWRKLCRWNLVQQNDRCICEFVPSLGPELVLKVTIIRRKDFEAAQQN
ncbi:B3 domain-containing protein At5g60140-like [Ipomoea triloba]|uniref:B3 domain-containing protein At5g60140-like n=1 Tax=Ipomoea triloba TaxID=35885 RepID=UPI00125DA3AB|nr:B3 domain-containing protein At5g60140-like [Ipomoea triloba]